MSATTPKAPATSSGGSGASPRQEAPFSRAVVLLVTAICAVSVLVALVSGIFGGSAPPTTVSNDAFSDSALGHSTFIALLEARYEEVRVQRRPLQDGIDREDLIIIAEPVIYDRVSEDRLEQLDTYLASNAPIVLFLPKRLAASMTPTQELASTELILPWDITALLRYFGVNDLQAVQTSGTLNREGLRLNEAQLLRGPSMENGALTVERVRENGAPLLIVSDPDVIANHAIGNASNAAFAMRAVGALYRGGDVVVDERLHGHVDVASISRRAFDYPTVLVTFQLLLLVGLLAWRSAVAFAPRSQTDNVRTRDQQTLVATTAQLLSWASPHDRALKRYREMLISDAARRLHAPADLAEDELIVWLDEVAERQGRTLRLGPLAARTPGPRQQDEIRRIAQQLHRWHREITDAA